MSRAFPPAVCEGKAPMSPEIARKVASRIAKNKRLPEMEAYRCPVCGQWHIGSKPKRWHPSGHPNARRSA